MIKKLYFIALASLITFNGFCAEGKPYTLLKDYYDDGLIGYTLRSYRYGVCFMKQVWQEKEWQQIDVETKKLVVAYKGCTYEIWRANVGPSAPDWARFERKNQNFYSAKNAAKLFKRLEKEYNNPQKK